MEADERAKMVKAKMRESIEEVFEEACVLIDTHFFNKFTETKSSAFLKKVIASQNTIDLNLFQRTWRSLNCSTKTMKEIREIQENILCVGKRNVVHKENDEMIRWYSKTGIALNAKTHR